MLSQQIKNELPADLIMTIMQYACYKTHDTAKMIKQAVEDEHELKHGVEDDWNCFGILGCVGYRMSELYERRYEDEEEAMNYIEVDSAGIVTDINSHAELMEQEVSVVGWFQQVTYMYADCSDEYRDNLIIYCKMIDEVEHHSDEVRVRLGVTYRSWSKASARGRAWGLYKIISDCPTSVY